MKVALCFVAGMLLGSAGQLAAVSHYLPRNCCEAQASCCPDGECCTSFVGFGGKPGVRQPLVITFFREDGCVPCAKQEKLLKELGVPFRKVDVHKQTDTAKEYGITAEVTPVVVFERGLKRADLVGYHGEAEVTKVWKEFK